MRKTAISVVVPIYNNEDILSRTIAQLEAFFSVHFEDYEFLFVDDASTDGSLHILHEAASENRRIRVLVHEYNKGQQHSIATGMLAATGDIVLGVDADLPCEISELQKLATHAAQGLELVLGKRLSYEPRSWWRNSGSWLGNFLFRLLFPYHISDFGCSTAAVRRSLIEKFRAVNPGVLVLKPELLRLAESYVEIEVAPNAEPALHKSGYSAFKLVKLFASLVASRMQSR